MNFGSLFAGIGGMDLGLERAGMRCLWQVEIDKDCNRVLERHYPNVTRYADVREVERLESVDVICGGFPCQDLSVAGKRSGLAGERSGLWFEFLRIIESNLPRFVVIENVPGLLSSDDGRDFAVIIRGLVECGYCVAWRILDAQYDGVAQRRRRVFIVGSLGDGSCAEILFESEGVSWNPPARREAGKRVAATITPRTDGNSKGWSPVNEADNLVPTWYDGQEIAESLTVSKSQQNMPDKGNFMGVLAPTVTSKWAKGSGGPAGSELGNLVAATLNSGGNNGGNNGGFRSEPGEHLVPSLVSNGDAHSGFRDERGLVAFAQNSRDEVRIQGDGQISGALSAEPGMKQSTYLAFHENKSGQLSEADVLGLRSGASHSYQGIGNSVGVRRLTPRECERLQGFPDDYTAGVSDSARYRMLGNAVCTKTAEWIGRRIVEHDN